MKQGFYRYFSYFYVLTSFCLILARIYQRPKIKMLVGHAFILLFSFSVQVNEAEGYLEVRNTGLLPNGEYTVVHMFQTFCDAFEKTKKNSRRFAGSLTSQTQITRETSSCSLEMVNCCFVIYTYCHVLKRFSFMLPFLFNLITQKIFQENMKT